MLEILAHLQVKYVIAIGRFAERRVVSLLKNKNVTDIKVSTNVITYIYFFL